MVAMSKRRNKTLGIASLLAFTLEVVSAYKDGGRPPYYPENNVNRCEFPGTNGYFITGHRFPYSGASIACAALGGTLADVNYKNYLFISEFVSSCAGPNQKAWINSWDRSRNDHGRGNRDCLSIGGPGNSLNAGIDTSCSNERKVVCRLDPSHYPENYPHRPPNWDRPDHGRPPYPYPYPYPHHPHHPHRPKVITITKTVGQGTVTKTEIIKVPSISIKTETLTKTIVGPTVTLHTITLTQTRTIYGPTVTLPPVIITQTKSIPGPTITLPPVTFTKTKIETSVVSTTKFVTLPASTVTFTSTIAPLTATVTVTKNLTNTLYSTITLPPVTKSTTIVSTVPVITVVTSTKTSVTVSTILKTIPTMITTTQYNTVTVISSVPVVTTLTSTKTITQPVTVEKTIISTVTSVSTTTFTKPLTVEKTITETKSVDKIIAVTETSISTKTLTKVISEVSTFTLPVTTVKTTTEIKVIPTTIVSTYVSTKLVPTTIVSTYVSTKLVPTTIVSTYVSTKLVPTTITSTYVSTKLVPTTITSTFTTRFPVTTLEYVTKTLTLPAVTSFVTERLTSVSTVYNTLSITTTKLVTNVITLPPVTTSIKHSTTITLSGSTITVPITEVVTVPGTTISVRLTDTLTIPGPTIHSTIRLPGSTVSIYYVSTQTLTQVIDRPMYPVLFPGLDHEVTYEWTGSYQYSLQYKFDFPIPNFHGAGTYTLYNGAVVEIFANGSYNFISGVKPPFKFQFPFIIPDFHGPGQYTLSPGNVVEVFIDGTYKFISGGPPKFGESYSIYYPFYIPGFHGAGTYTLANNDIVEIFANGSYKWIRGPSDGNWIPVTTVVRSDNFITLTNGDGTIFTVTYDPFQGPGIATFPTITLPPIRTVSGQPAYPTLTLSGGIQVGPYTGPGIYVYSYGHAVYIGRNGEIIWVEGGPQVDTNGKFHFKTITDAKSEAPGYYVIGGAAYRFPFIIPHFHGEGFYDLGQGCIVHVKPDGSYTILYGSVPSSLIVSNVSTGFPATFPSITLPPVTYPTITLPGNVAITSFKGYGIYEISPNVYIYIDANGNYTYLNGNAANGQNVGSISLSNVNFPSVVIGGRYKIPNFTGHGVYVLASGHEITIDSNGGVRWFVGGPGSALPASVISLPNIPVTTVNIPSGGRIESFTGPGLYTLAPNTVVSVDGNARYSFLEGSGYFNIKSGSLIVTDVAKRVELPGEYKVLYYGAGTYTIDPLNTVVISKNGGIRWLRGGPLHVLGGSVSTIFFPHSTVTVKASTVSYSHIVFKLPMSIPNFSGVGTYTVSGTTIHIKSDGSYSFASAINKRGVEDYQPVSSLPVTQSPSLDGQVFPNFSFSGFSRRAKPSSSPESILAESDAPENNGFFNKILGFF